MSIKPNLEIQSISIKYTIITLTSIALISLLLKLYTMDFSFPVNSDVLAYSLQAISHTNGDFSQSSHRGIGWSLFVSFFYSFIDSENFLIYSNVIRILSIIVSTSTIFLVYLLGKKFFNQKYSLVVAALYAFEPHLNYNSGFGLTEPLYHLAIIGAFYFLINKNTKFIIPSLIIAGAIWWIRLNGIVFFIIIIIIFIITKRNSPNFLRNLLLGISIFLVIVSPMLYDRSQQFDDPFYIAYSQYVFSGTFEKMISIEEKNTTSTASDYIEANGILPFLKSFFLDGIYNIISTLWRISFPYLFILIPFGIIFSFRAFDQDRNSITANWIFIILSLASLTITFSLISEKRYLYYLFPFLIIFCVIPVQRVTTYGLNTFSFSEKQKSIFLIIIMLIALVLATSFTLRYDQIDDSLEIEKYEFSKYILNNLDGNSLREFGGSLDYLKLVYVENSPEKFKNCEVEFNKKLCGYDKSEGYVQRITITGNSIEEILDKGQTYDLKYIFVNKERNDFHGFIDDIYFKEDDYPYLEKIFDSDTHGFQNLKVKVFEINYDEYWNFKKINN
tara:strand:+ start:23877 stop:25553 length:1677 start_codon:yes stop_codon:yes gene_type:complete